MEHVANVASWLDRHPDRVVLLGAQPTVPETEYGWIEPAEPLGELPTGDVRSVRRFVEKPSLATARACLAAGHLWNTSVIVAKVSMLVELGRLGMPALHDRLARLRQFAGTPDEAAAVHQAYELMPKANFSRDILEACPQALAVSKLPRAGLVGSREPQPHDGSAETASRAARLGGSVAPIGLTGYRGLGASSKRDPQPSDPLLGSAL